MGLVATVGLAAAEASALTVLGLALLHARRRIGVLPFAAYLSLLAAAVPLTVTHTSLDLGSLGTLPHAQAAIAPAVVALVALVHLTNGWRNAQIAALVPLGAALLAAAGTLAEPRMPLLVASALLPADAALALAAGAALWAGAALASASLAGIADRARRLPALPALFAAAVLGQAAAGGAALGFLRAGLPLGNASGWAPLVGPVAAGLPAAAIATAYAAARLSDLWERTRRDLLSREPVGTDSQVEAARALQRHREVAEERTRREVDTYRSLIEADDRGAYVCNANGRVTYANQALGRVLQRPDADLDGENVRHLFGGPDAHGRPRFVDYPVEPGRHRARVPLPDGRERSIEVTVRPTEDGRLYGRVRDRTEEVLRRQLEEQKQRAEFYVDLLRHDIGNDVTTPLNYLTLLEASDNLDEREQRYVQASRAAVEDIADLLDRVNVLTRLQDADAEPTDAARLLREAARQFQEKHADEVELSSQLPDEPVLVSGHPLLETAFGNLLGNAIRHAGAEPEIAIGAHRDGDAWVLRIDDNGPGVPDGDKEEIFERGDRDEAVGGQGLGLYIVRTVVNALDGEVWVEDRVEGEPERGASFRVRLPATTGEAADLGSRSSLPVDGSVGTPERGEA